MNWRISFTSSRVAISSAVSVSTGEREGGGGWPGLKRGSELVDVCFVSLITGKLIKRAGRGIRNGNSIKMDAVDLAGDRRAVER